MIVLTILAFAGKVPREAPFKVALFVRRTAEKPWHKRSTLWALLRKRSRLSVRLGATEASMVPVPPTMTSSTPRASVATLCFHGGAFFSAIGEEFRSLERRHEVINADVLDAWFAPSPKVLSALRKNLGWFVRTSPPTYCEGMVKAISEATAASLVHRCRQHDLYVRDATSMGSRIDGRTVRVAVKDEATNRRMVEILEEVLGAASST